MTQLTANEVINQLTLMDTEGVERVKEYIEKELRLRKDLKKEVA